MVKKIYYPETYISDNSHISIGQFRKMDRVSIEKYQISIELMMENAGLQLARLVTEMIPAPCNILVGIEQPEEFKVSGLLKCNII